MKIPQINDYCTRKDVAGSFENQILYRMCRDEPDHKSAYVISGKVIAIGRVYAASPERGAGQVRADGEPLTFAIGKKLQCSKLDHFIGKIDPNARLSDPGVFDAIIQAHALLVEELNEAITYWRAKDRKKGWTARKQLSFSSKYLHFHRPNAFPIMDSFSKSGLNCAGNKGSFDSYERFCGAFLEYVQEKNNDWTPRNIDTNLVYLGRFHRETKPGSSCPKCGYNKRIRNSK